MNIESWPLELREHMLASAIAYVVPDEFLPEPRISMLDRLDDWADTYFSLLDSGAIDEAPEWVMAEIHGYDAADHPSAHIRKFIGVYGHFIVHTVKYVVAPKIRDTIRTWRILEGE